MNDGGDDTLHDQAFGDHVNISYYCRDIINDIRNNYVISEFKLSPDDSIHFPPLAFQLLGLYIANNCYLEELNLSGVGTNHILAMVPFLRDSQNLCKLNLSNNVSFNNEAFEVLINELDGGDITELTIDNCSIEDLSVLGNCTLPNLRVLSLRVNNIRDVGDLSALENYTKLHSLFLEHNNIGREGCLAIADLLQKEGTRLETYYG